MTDELEETFQDIGLDDPPTRAELVEMGWRDPKLGVRRHIIWNKLRPDLKEDLAHLVQYIKRRICGVASAGSPSFSV